jgi:hypothetical protein
MANKVEGIPSSIIKGVDPKRVCWLRVAERELGLIYKTILIGRLNNAQKIFTR